MNCICLLSAVMATISMVITEDVARGIADTFTRRGIQGSSGIIHVKTENWSSKDGVTKRTEKTQAWGGSGASFLPTRNYGFLATRQILKTPGTYTNKCLLYACPPTPPSPSLSPWNEFILMVLSILIVHQSLYVPSVFVARGYVLGLLALGAERPLPWIISPKLINL